jgi:hypothetical protein
MNFARFKATLSKFIRKPELKYLAVFIVGAGVGYVLGLYKVHQLLANVRWPHLDFTFIKEWINTINSLHLNADFLQDIMNLEAVLIGVAIPISLEVVLSIMKEYEKDVSKFFIREPLYVSQFFLLFTNIIASFVIRMFDINNPWILLILLIWSIVNIVIFGLFMLLVKNYVTDTDNVLINKLWKNAKNIFQ